ncbi:MAG: ParB-like nuclease domain-containing protein [Butyrivibrio sp.]|nr:ParB-like nuclease domain-containing protein [Butyrivibrio sp.]
MPTREPFEKYLEDQIKKYNGIAFPVKSSLLRRAFVQKANVLDLHPNPDDEFTKPGIGPSYRIISEYVNKFRENQEKGFGMNTEPLIIEKMHPEGYMLVNGHHRWAAYYKLDKKRVPVSVVNLTHEEDIIKMIESGTNDKRVTFDLDEVVFGATGEDEVEKSPSLFFTWTYKEKIKKGIPALFIYLSHKGYDIWVYTSKFYSIDYIRGYMKKYHVNVTGIITGTGRNVGFSESAKSNIDKKIAGKYKYTLHIDNDSVVRTNTQTKEFEDYEIKTEKKNWSQAIMDIVEKMSDGE